MATKAKGISQGSLLCTHCGTTSGMEFIGPPKLQYSRYDSIRGTEYELRIEIDMFCTDCDQPQKFVALEDKEGVKLGAVRHPDPPTFLPIMDWPKQMEADAITWAMDLEGRK